MTVILLHEPTSHWTAELERQCSGKAVALRWRPHFSDLLTETRSEPPRLILLTGAADADRLDQIVAVKRAAPAARLALIVETPSADWEWAARELGADAVLDAASEQRRVVDSVLRLL